MRNLHIKKGFYKIIIKIKILFFSFSFLLILEGCTLDFNEEKEIFDLEIVSVNQDKIIFYNDKSNHLDTSYQNIRTYHLNKKLMYDSLILRDHERFIGIEDKKGLAKKFLPKIPLDSFRDVFYNRDSVISYMKQLRQNQLYKAKYSRCDDCKTLNNFFKKKGIKFKFIQNQKKYKWLIALVKRALIGHAFEYLRFSNYTKGYKNWPNHIDNSWSRLKKFYQGNQKIPLIHKLLKKYNKNLFYSLSNHKPCKTSYIFCIKNGYLFGVISFYPSKEGYLKVDRYFFNPEILLYYSPIMKR